MNKTVNIQYKGNYQQIRTSEELLADSIQRAKDKILKIQNIPTDRSLSINEKSILYDLSNSSFKSRKDQKNNFIGAIKILQNQVKELQVKNTQNQNIIKNQKKEIESHFSQIELINNNKRQLILKNQSLLEKIQTLKKSQIELNYKVSRLTEEILTLKKQLSVLNNQKHQQNSQKCLIEQYREKLQEIEKKQKYIIKLQEINYLSTIKSNEIITQLTHFKKINQQKIKQLTEINLINQSKIERLLKNLEEQINKNKLTHSLLKDKYYHQNRQLGNKKSSTKITNNNTIQLQNQQIKQNNQQLYNLLKQSKDKYNYCLKEKKKMEGQIL